jgi:hypothetical protein
LASVELTGGGAPQRMKTDPKTTAGRAFVRSLNILLKFARLYGYDHVRVAEQLKTAWGELRTAMPEGSATDLLLGASGGQLLLDGVPLEGSPAEKQFAQLLSAAGLASVQFTPHITLEELSKFVHAFPTGKAKPTELAQQLKEAIADAQGIRVNEVCFVATDSRLKEASLAAQIAAASVGEQQDQFRKLLNDPKRLLELIAAVEGSKAGAEGGSAEGEIAPGAGRGEKEVAPQSGSGGGARFGFLGGVSGSGWGAPSTPAGTSAKGVPGALPRSGEKEFLGLPDEESIFRILQAITTFGSIGTSVNPSATTVEFQDELSKMNPKAQSTLRDALAGLAELGKNKKLDESVLVQLAEHLAIRFALEQFERGNVKVNAVRQMLDRMNQEIAQLRKILGQHEDKMADAGILAETHREMLDRAFWESVPENIKREVLLSEEAWCIPPKNVESYVGQLLKHGEKADAISILRNYARCADSEEPDARKRAATGLLEMATLYAEADPKLLLEALRYIGLRLSVEQDQNVQSLVSAAFVRLSQEAAVHRHFPAMTQALNFLEGVEAQRPGISKSLRMKMGIEERVPEFVEEALKVRAVAAGLTGVLKHMPQTAMEQLATRFSRCQFRGDLENVASLAQDLGEEALGYLRETVRGGPIAEAVEMVGLLTKLDPQATEAHLPRRLKDFPRTAQDRVVRQIAASGAPERCRLLLTILDHVDPLVMPLVVDEIGMTRERETLGRLLTLADGDLPAGGAAFLRVKALEALGRLQAPESIPTLRRIVDARKMFGWEHPQELRIAAFQALLRMDPEWAKTFQPNGGFHAEDLTLEPLEIPQQTKFVRQRRHARIRLQRSVTAVSTNLKQNCRLEIKTASLAGGLATTSAHLAPGTRVEMRMQLGLRNVQATALMRDYRAQDISFEIIDMGLDERARFRRLLVENLGQGGTQ